MSFMLLENLNKLEMIEILCRKIMHYRVDSNLDNRKLFSF